MTAGNNLKWAQARKLALEYIQGLRNAKKRKYASDYLDFKMGDSQNSPKFDGLSYMAAQAVRIEINNRLEAR